MIFDYRRIRYRPLPLPAAAPLQRAATRTLLSLSLSPSLPPAYPNTHHRASTRPPVL